MDSILEEKRSLHEERDRIELAIINEMLSKKTSHRDKLDSEHRQKELLDRYMKCSKTLYTFYEQQSRLPNEELYPSKNASTSFTNFYIALRDIKEFYVRHTNEQVSTLASEFELIEAARQIALGLKPTLSSGNDPSNGEDAAEDENSDSNQGDDALDPGDSSERDGEIQRLTQGLPSGDLVDIVEPAVAPVAKTAVIADKQFEFTDEEGYGRYLDLNKCHEAYLQIIKREENKPNYLSFLEKFDQFSELDREYKLTSSYKIYVEMLLEYFRSYCKRAKPLFDYQDMENVVYESFIQDWNEKTVPGWFKDTERDESTTGPMIDLESYRNCQELVELGLDCLKKELQARGLKCGGTLEERANRLWSVRGKSDDQIDDTLRAGAVGSKKRKTKANINPFYIASVEAKVAMYAEYFNDHRQATIENVQRKQARTAEERNDSDEEISDIDDDDDDQGNVIYNPKNLPLGWDGKPIPYWLYKLHGLNLTFTCEICGNATYKGPKTFQRHFAEWRHAHGMRCLGIPNTAHFANITKIQDAISLWDKLKNERQKDKFQPLNEEEYEDSQGNVVNKKTYEDLKRQGLL